MSEPVSTETLTLELRRKIQDELMFLFKNPVRSHVAFVLNSRELRILQIAIEPPNELSLAGEQIAARDRIIDQRDQSIVHLAVELQEKVIELEKLRPMLTSVREESEYWRSEADRLRHELENPQEYRHRA